MHPAPKKVFVADADAIVLALVTHILQRQGFAAEPINELDRVIHLMRDGDFDAMIVDAMLHGVVDTLKMTPERASRIILTSAHEYSEDHGTHAVLRKPLEFGLLVETVRDCVDRGE